jgi:hypothetical protein
LLIAMFIFLPFFSVEYSWGCLLYFSSPSNPSFSFF